MLSFHNHIFGSMLWLSKSYCSPHTHLCVDYFVFHRHEIPAPQEGVDFIFLHHGERKRRVSYVLRPSEVHLCAYCRNKGGEGDHPMEEHRVRLHLEQK
jgi:hypothetical protein